MQPWTKRDCFTYIVLLVLLFIRFPVADFTLFLQKLFGPSMFSLNFENLRSIQNQSLEFLYQYSLLVVAVIIIVNRNNLYRLNIDKAFLWIFVSGCLTYNWNNNWELKVGILLVSLFILILSEKEYFQFSDKVSDKEPKNWPMIYMIVAGFLLSLVVMADSITIVKIRWVVEGVIPGFPYIVVEEVLFRGMLWMFLRHINLSEVKILILQAIIFWLSHVNAANDLIFFWLLIPAASIFLGIIVWRSKSITPSTIAHTLINALFGFVAFRNL